MHKILKRLITPLTLLLSLFAVTTYADYIRIVGPNGQVQSSPEVPQQVSKAVVMQTKANFYGPISNNETLWSVATQLRPSKRYSVQQTLLAIYKLNPQAFENRNIHKLIPGSRLSIPSQAQVEAESTAEAIQIMKAHKAGSIQQSKPSQQNQSPRQTQQIASQEPSQPQAAASQNKVVVPEPLTQQESIKEVDLVTPQPSKPTEAQAVQQLAETESRITELEEENHRLRVRLSELQNEAGNLKTELDNESRLRSEAEARLKQESEKAADATATPGLLDTLLSNMWLVILLALIPGLLLVAIIILILTRNKAKQETQQLTDAKEEVIEEEIVGEEIVGEAIDEDMSDINLDEISIDETESDKDDSDISDDDNLFDDDFFSLNDEPQAEQQDEAITEPDDGEFKLGLDDDELFAGIDESEDKNLDSASVAQGVDASEQHQADTVLSELSEENTELSDDLLQEKEPDATRENDAQGFDFAPHIEGSEQADEQQELENADDYLANLDEFDAGNTEESEPQTTEPESLILSDDELGEYDEASALADVMEEFEEFSEPLEEAEAGVFELSDDELGEYDENSAFADVYDEVSTAGSNITETSQEAWQIEPAEDSEPQDDYREASNATTEPLKQTGQYKSVEELMAQSEVVAENEVNPDEEELKLDVGLNEFPDVIGDVEQFDVDANAEASGKLDLAKIYIEMNDSEGAGRLLQEAIAYGDEETRQQANTLLDKINKDRS